MTFASGIFLFSFDAPVSHLLKISDLLPSSKSVNPIGSIQDVHRTPTNRIVVHLVLHCVCARTMFLPELARNAPKTVE